MAESATVGNAAIAGNTSTFSACSQDFVKGTDVSRLRGMVQGCTVGICFCIVCAVEAKFSENEKRIRGAEETGNERRTRLRKKGEDGGRADDGKAKQDKAGMARRRSAGEAREKGTGRGPVEERGASARSKKKGGWLANSGDSRKEENGARGERKEETERG